MRARQSHAVQVTLALVRATATDPGSNHTATYVHARMWHTWCTHPPRIRPYRQNANRLDPLAPRTPYECGAKRNRRNDNRPASNCERGAHAVQTWSRTRSAATFLHARDQHTRSDQTRQAGTRPSPHPERGAHMVLKWSRPRSAATFPHTERCNLSTHMDTYVMPVCVCVWMCVCVFCDVRKTSAHVW